MYVQVCAVPALPQQGAVSVQVTEEPQLHTEHRNERKDLKDENSNTEHTWTGRDRQVQTGELSSVKVSLQHVFNVNEDLMI